MVQTVVPAHRTGRTGGGKEGGRDRWEGGKKDMCPPPKAPWSVQGCSHAPPPATSSLGSTLCRSPQTFWSFPFAHSSPCSDPFSGSFLHLVPRALLPHRAQHPTPSLERRPLSSIPSTNILTSGPPPTTPPRGHTPLSLAESGCLLGPSSLCLPRPSPNTWALEVPALARHEPGAQGPG